MFTVRIANEFLHGPVWVLDEDGISAAEGSLSVVERDAEVQRLNREAGELFDSYYAFDAGGEVCSFDEAAQRANRDRMLVLVGELRRRLEEINDGTYTVEDAETPFLEGI